MSTIGQMYKAGKTSAVVRKQFWMPPEEIYAEDGYNIRDVDQQHVEEFRDAYIAGEYVPPLTVEVTSKGVKVIDGHHRLAGALLAVAAGTQLRLPVNDITGATEADKIALMVTSSQGKSLEPLERSRAYLRMKAQGWTNDEIAKKVKCSISAVANMLALSEVPESMKVMVKENQMSYATAIDMIREHGPDAEKVAAESLGKAESQGKKKVTKKIISDAPVFGKKQAMRLTELAVSFGIDEDQDITGKPDDDVVTLQVPAGVAREFFALVSQYIGEEK